MPNNKKILIIEDEDYIADMYEMKFAQNGYKVLIARDGEEGYLMSKKNRPDLILLDLVLPKKDGYSVLRELKEDRVTKKIPVVIASNLGQKEEIEEGLELGAIDYIVKSNITPSELMEKVKERIR